MREKMLEYCFQNWLKSGGSNYAINGKQSRHQPEFPFFEDEGICKYGQIPVSLSSMTTSEDSLVNQITLEKRERESRWTKE
mmetsp:Transcript_36931/g.89700  ORF Transcript_36931/g.89700 Transcript_36931/m.89700 type:complete len:81 (+) Transcript_36931:954-1196(+)